MSRVFKALAIIFLLVIVGCSSSTDESEGKFNKPKTANLSFSGTIKEINSNTAIVNAKLGGEEGDVLVNLSVNSEETFQVGDRIKVGYDGTIMESSPAKINTLFVESID